MKETFEVFFRDKVTGERKKIKLVLEIPPAIKKTILEGSKIPKGSFFKKFINTS